MHVCAFVTFLMIVSQCESTHSSLCGTVILGIVAVLSSSFLSICKQKLCVENSVTFFTFFFFSVSSSFLRFCLQSKHQLTFRWSMPFDFKTCEKTKVKLSTRQPNINDKSSETNKQRKYAVNSSRRTSSRGFAAPNMELRDVALA